MSSKCEARRSSSSRSRNDDNHDIVDDELSRFVGACRHVSAEACMVLTSLRGGPPVVARGDLTLELMELRTRVERFLEATVQTQQQRQQQGEQQEEEKTEVPLDDAGASGRPNRASAAVVVQQQPHPIAQPFLKVIMDPRAAGPHTLVTLRAVHRLLRTGTLTVFGVTAEELTSGILACKFEQTDAGADEAVEMAIADVLSLLVQRDDVTKPDNACTSMKIATLMDAFNTVFVTRNTFVHSPALCYHFEDVLTTMVVTVFQQLDSSTGGPCRHPAAVKMLEFLVNQLLHTPLVGGDGLDESTREAQMAHDDTRTLCLRLTRTALRTGWGNVTSGGQVVDGNEATTVVASSKNPPASKDSSQTDDSREILSSSPSEDDGDDNGERTLLQIIQDDLCLSLLMTGQAIWAYHDTHSAVSPGYVSLEVLSEICATLSILWNTVSLRQELVSQFETIFTGFYTRALVLLRKRKQPVNSITFNANLIFDAEVEIILESLVDILCLHDHRHSIADGDGGALETLFSYYDCHMRRSDVASGLFVELSRCCGGTVNEDGDEARSRSRSDSSSVSLMLPPPPPRSGNSLPDRLPSNETGDVEKPAVAATPPPVSTGALNDSMVRVEHPQRQVPAHLKELCATALMGGMKCLFRDDCPSEKTLQERSKRRKSIMLRQLDEQQALEQEGFDLDETPRTTSHVLRDVKSKKRLMRKAARIFNQKASRGIEFLVDSGLVADPVTPAAMAAFLRNGIVVGLDKKAVGAYLGEAGKGPMAGKSPPSWERDWFHKEVLEKYCSLFRFEDQSLLDGLRMFLACFRLPGEAQQIDRILQAFADSCGRVCEESSRGRLKLFSEDPKRASDAAYLLSFSIIMLNTDRHNANIREDRKMSLDDFVKNNTDYGRDITEKGKEFPREYLASIYESINEEEIRTEGEGADGAMTVERWKDVLRGSTDTSEEDMTPPSVIDAEDLTEIVLEHVWKPIMSAIGALWGVNSRHSHSYEMEHGSPGGSSAQSGMLGVQGARLGMDLSLEMLNGVRQLGRIDIFRHIFSWICEYTGLLGEYALDSVDRTWALTKSVEAQGAVVVVMRTVLEAGEDLDEDCWKRVWSILLELRDLKMLARGKNGRAFSLLHESDPDLLNEAARVEWTMCLIKGDMNYNSRATRGRKEKGVTSVLGAFGRAIFGSDENDYSDSPRATDNENFAGLSPHGKEKLVVWDEGAPSDDENDIEEGKEPESPIDQSAAVVAERLTVGSRFESQLIRENEIMSKQMNMPVTGLERVDEARRYQTSPRLQVRERFRRCCNFAALVLESRYMDEASFRSLLHSLVSLLSTTPSQYIDVAPPAESRIQRSGSDLSFASTASFTAAQWAVPLSPASEAFAEVLICELALKNKDRLKALWSEILQDHYLSRLTSLLVNPSDARGSTKIPVDPGLEKRVTGLLRLSIFAVQREDIANEVLSAWKYLLPVNDEQHASSPLRALDRHIGEGLWRIVAQSDNLLHLNDEGWSGLNSILYWCAKRGGALRPIPSGGSSGLAEEDPALQCYRSLHLLLHTKELEEKVPFSIVGSLRCLTAAGGRRNYAQLSIASLDLMSIMYEKKLLAAMKENAVDSPALGLFWQTCWRKIVEGMAEAAELSTNSNIRQHALSLLTDLFLDQKGSLVPIQHFGSALSEVIIPLAGRRIIRLQMRDKSVTTSDQLMMEFDLCIGLIFKPLRHHLQDLLGSAASLSSIWKAVLVVLEELLNDKPLEGADEWESIPKNLRKTMNSLVNEHLQNAISVLISTGVLLADPKAPGDITEMTWDSVIRMGISDGELKRWKQQAADCMDDPGSPTVL